MVDDNRPVVLKWCFFGFAKAAMWHHDVVGVVAMLYETQHVLL